MTSGPETTERTIGEAILAGNGKTATDIARQVGVNPSAAWRWMTRGVRRSDGKVIRLAHVRLGRTLYSCDEAILAFIDACKNPREGDGAEDSPRTSRPRVHPRRVAEIAAAGAEAASLGI